MSSTISIDAITIGIEIEMVLLDFSGEDPFMFIKDAVEPVEFRLVNGGAVINPALMAEYSFSRPWPVENFIPGLELFQVKQDYSIETPDLTSPEGRADSVEIATPILRNQNWVWLVPEMCNAIISACVKSETLISFNQSTGLHVHIGIGNPYNLDQLKRISLAIIIFEQQMNLHHDASREQGFYIAPCRNSEALFYLTTEEMVEKINEQDTIHSLLCTINSLWGSQGLSHSRNYKYNLTATSKFGTVEFRQAGATLDSDKILNWVANIIRFVTAAIDTPYEVFYYWAVHGVVDQEVYERFGVPCP